MIDHEFVASFCSTLRCGLVLMKPRLDFVNLPASSGNARERADRNIREFRTAMQCRLGSLRPSLSVRVGAAKVALTSMLSAI